MRNLDHIEEPDMLFAYNQKCKDVRDGLSLFGPLETPRIYGIRSGVVGTKKGLAIFKNYINSIQKPVFNNNNITRPMFPGFEAVFNCKWESSNVSFKEIYETEINKLLYNDSNHKRTFDLVTLFISRIIEAVKNEEDKVDIWYVIVPDEIYKYCRPNSAMPKQLVQTNTTIKKYQAKKIIAAPSLFVEDNEAAEAYKFDAQFHDQLKARMLEHTVPTQILREGTLNWREVKNRFGAPIRDFSKIEGHLAWTISTTTFYKAGGKPWKLADIRDRVCYLGLVYKHVEKSSNPLNACCAAQMFLDNGDGTVFKGAVGPWYTGRPGDFHLNAKEAKSLLMQALESYKSQMGGYPKEVFIHAKSRFNWIEWNAFSEVIPEGTNLVGISITDSKPLKLYKSEGDFPILRGSAYLVNDTSAFLWTLGYVPKIQTSLSMEVPNPIYVEINKGQASILQVLKDIMALTKLNYNACIYADGLPVTLRFADKIGEILTASMDIKAPPLAFKYYI